MDSFDDLLVPSRNILEENPFSDPFAKRSNSPDPWASPFSQPSTDVYNTGFNDQEPYTEPETPETPTAAVHEEPQAVVVASSAESDPLDSANQTADDDDDNEPLGRRVAAAAPPRSTGFKESIPETFSEIATIRPTEPEQTIPAPIVADIPEPQRSSTPTAPPRTDTPPTSVATPPPAAASSHTHANSLSQSISKGSVVSSGSSTSAPNPEWGAGPLDRVTPIDRSFAGLGLGEQSHGGWRSEQDSWTNDHPVSSVPTEDSDDDKPISQIMKHSEQANQASPSRQNTSGRNEIQPVFVITVDDPQKVGDPIRSFTMYTVHTQTTSPLFQKSTFSVLRRYSDFLWLYETLSINNPGVVVPPVPEKNPFGRFDDQFVRQRRFALEKCIQKIANHPVLGKDTDLKMFLESDSFALDIKHRKAEIAHERGGLMASLGQAVTGPRFYETDEWFDRQKAYLDSLESQLRGLVKAIEMVARQRLELSTATGEFAQTVGDLSSSDVGKQLSQSLSGLADVERKAQDLQTTQSEQDMITLMGTVDEYARLINSVRLAFNSRIRTYHAWRTADADLLRVKQNHERNRAQGRIPTDRLGFSLSQIAEAERRALDAKHDFDHVSKLIKSELARFEQERIEDFKDSLHAFLEGMILRQKDLIESWENYQQMLLRRVGGGRGLPQASAVSQS